jgi:hypothetical protein
MGMWNEYKFNCVLVKGGKKNRRLSQSKMEGKHASLKTAKPDIWYWNSKSILIKIREKEGEYRVKFNIDWEIKIYSKEALKNPLPADSPFESFGELGSVQLHTSDLKMPAMHTMEIQARLNRIKNYGSRSDPLPVAMFDIDIKTGHMVMGSWTEHQKCCDVYLDKGIKNLR